MVSPGSATAPALPVLSTSRAAREPRRPDLVDAADVAELFGVRGYPSVSLLMDTTPAPRMLPADVARLAALQEEVLAVMERDPLLHRGDVRRRLETQVREAARGATSRGLAVFTNHVVQRTLRLAASVPRRAVVQRAFVTRDLVRTMHRTPPYLLLHLTGTQARLYRGAGDHLETAPDAAFPVPGDGGDAHLDRVDEALAAARRRHPSPVVLAGSSALLSRFRSRSTQLHRLAGTMSGSDTGAPATMSVVAAQLIATYLASREQEALALLADTAQTTPTRVARGLARCWWVVHHGRPQMLVVEEGYACPAYVDGSGVAVTLAPDGSLPTGVRPVGTYHPDLVDDLIATVVARGGWVAFARDGMLAEQGGVALVVADAG